MTPKELLEACESVMKSFNPQTTTVDSHTKDILGIAEGANAEPSKVFIKQVFYGCVRYKDALKIFLSSFYYNNSGKTSRNDYTRYMILGYLALFRLHELGFERFRSFIMADEPLKMMVFLEFVFNDETLDITLKDELCRIFDRDFVEDDIVVRVKKFFSEAAVLMDDLRMKAYGIAAAKAKKEEDKVNAFKGKGPTKFAPFKLNTPRPRKVSEPMKIEQGIKAKPVPHRLLNKTSLAQIEEEDRKRKAESHRKTYAKYENIKREPKLNETKSTVQQLRLEVEEERMAPCRVQFKAKPVPVFQTTAQIKYTASSILREDALYKKKQAKEAAALQKYETELRDSTDYFRWRAEGEKIDEAKKLKRVEQVRLEVEASHVRAAECIAQNLAKKKQTAARMKVELDKALKKNEKEAEAIVLRNRRMAAEIRKVRDANPQIAVKKVYAANQKKRVAIKIDIADRIARKQEEDKIEQDRRNDLIRQIRAIERVPKLRAKHFDPTESSGIGLLEEMSLVELKERLRMGHAREEEEVVEKRQKIMLVKQKKEAKLKARIDNIRRVRKLAHKEARIQRKQYLQAEKDKKAREREISDKAMKEVVVKIEATRAARDKEINDLAEAEEKVAKQRMFLGAAASMVEEKKFEELLNGKSREAAARQFSKKIEQKVWEKTIAGENKQRVSNKKKLVRAAADRDEIEKRDLSRRKKEIGEREYEETQAKKALAKSVRSWEKSHSAYLRTINPYAARQNDMTTTAIRESRKNGGTGVLPQLQKSQTARKQSSKK
jgi:hypothetical protein